ncbi:hypothetical protein K1719_031853 [Acacia pycnantha]|nr:hypothetical protein K1719_031853 [Acacia pycnantha]
MITRQNTEAPIPSISISSSSLLVFSSPSPTSKPSHREPLLPSILHCADAGFLRPVLRCVNSVIFIFRIFPSRVT